MTTRCLSFHQTYGCRRSGACCTSSWPIPVEADRLARLRAALATGELRAVSPVSADRLFAESAGAPADAPALLGVDHGRCVFFDAAGGHSCRVQSALGHDALPLACRQFPRVSVVDPRGTSIALSCYCPTAAALLDTDGPVSIVSSPQAFPEAGEYVGLDARDTWAPLLRPGVMMDWDSWWRFEAHAVTLVGTVATTPEDALARLAFLVELVDSWGPGAEPLVSRIDAAFDSASSICATRRPFDPAKRDALVACVNAAIPAELREPTEPREPSEPSKPSEPREPGEPSEPALVRFLCCHAFANWTAHLGDGLGIWLRSVEAAYALVASGLTIREADLRLRHLVDPKVFVQRLSKD